MWMKQLKHLKMVNFFFEIFIIKYSLNLDGAIEALSGWTEMNNSRGNVRFCFFFDNKKKFCFLFFRVLPNGQIINQVIEIINHHHKHLRPMVFYDHHNVFQIYFKHLLKVVYRQQLVHHHHHFLNNRIIFFNPIHQLIFHFIHILVKVKKKRNLN